MDSAKYKVEDIANLLLRTVDRQSGDTMSPLKLQKLLYLIQGHYLAKYSKPLFDDDFEAWLHGPVVRKIWNKYKEYTYNSIPEPDNYYELVPDFDKETIDAVNYIYNKYGIFDAKYLEQLTHKTDPWIDNFDSFEDYHNNKISKEEIAKYFKVEEL